MYLLVICGLACLIKATINYIRRRRSRHECNSEIYNTLLYISSTRKTIFNTIIEKLGLSMNPNLSNAYIYACFVPSKCYIVKISETLTKHDPPNYINSDCVSIPCGGGDYEESRTIFEMICKVPNSISVSNATRTILSNYTFETTYLEHTKCVSYVLEKYAINLSKTKVTKPILEVCESEPFETIFAYGTGDIKTKTFKAEIVSDDVNVIIDHVTNIRYIPYIIIGLICLMVGV